MSTNLTKLISNNSSELEWKGQKSWIAFEVAKILGYDNPSKIINYFLNISELKEGHDYEVLVKEELKEIKSMLESRGITYFKQSPKLVLFYNNAMVEFLKYRNKLSDSEICDYMGINRGESNPEGSSISYNLMGKDFNGKKVNTFIWDNKPCWIATEIVDIFDYENTSKTINQCIKAEGFEVGFEYEILSGEDLKIFKKATTLAGVTYLKYVSKLIIFYEDGLYGFLQYTEKPIGIEFRKWLRREVLPELRKTGTYSIYEKEDVKEEEGYPNTKDNLIPLDNQDRVLQIIKLINNIMEINKENKISDLKEILYLK